MTYTILLIALMHGVPVVVAAAYWNTKLSVTLVALGMCGFAIVTGATQYAIFDLIVVGVAYFFCIRVVGSAQTNKGEPEPKQPLSELNRRKRERLWLSAAIRLIVVGGFLYFISKGGSSSPENATERPPQPPKINVQP